MDKNKDNWLEEERPGPLKTSLAGGAILAGVYILINLIASGILGSADAEVSSYMDYVLYAVTMASIFCIILWYRDRVWKSNISYGQAFKTAFLSVLFSAIIISIYTYIHFKLDPDAVTKIKNKILEKAAEKIDDDDKLAEQEKLLNQYMTAPWIAIGYLFKRVFVGTVISLVTSAFYQVKVNFRKK